MKSLKYLIIFTTIIFAFASQLKAQKKIEVRSICDNQVVKLRWMPADFKQMRHAQQYGYVIKRTKIFDAAGAPVDFEDRELTVFNVLPYNNTQWNTLPSSAADYVEAAKSLMTNLPIQMNDTLQVDPDTLTVRKLSHAYNQQKTWDNQFIYTLMLADQDFDVARGLGIAFADNTVALNVTYRYIIALDSIPLFESLNGSENKPISGINEIKILQLWNT